MMKVLPLLLVTITSMLYGETIAQGCSDAGFCSMGAMRPDQHYSKKLNLKIRSVELNQYLGITKFGTNIWAITLESNFGLGTKSSMQIKLPYMKTTGKGWGFQGIGDISLAFTRNVLNTENHQVNLTVGAKFPTNRSDLRLENGLPLPMYYQTSLGTYDFIIGASFITRNWLVAMGWQQPVFHVNENKFSPSAWEGNPRFNEIAIFKESVNLRRQADVMMRLERNLRLSRLNVNAGVLMIHRFTEDQVTDLDSGQKLNIEGSNGAAISLLVGSTYHFNTSMSLKVLFGQQLKQRDFNPDGLTREQVFSITYLYKFFN